MDIKDSYLHGTVGVVKSISVNADKLTYNLADVGNTARTVTLPLATTSANGLLSSTDKAKLDASTGVSQAIPYIVGPTTDTVGVWTGSHTGIIAYSDGLTIIYVPKVAGSSNGTTLNINGLGATTCYWTGSSKMTTHYPANTPILLTYVGGYWKRADYNSDTNTQLRVYRQKTSYNADYPLIASRTLASAIGTSGTDGSYSGVYGLIWDDTTKIPTVNPSTGEVKAVKFTGTLDGTAGKVTNKITIKINSGTTEGTSQYAYDGSAAKTLDIKNGTGIGFTNTAGVLSIYNSGVRSISTGTANGTISVNTNGTSANVAVKGLGSAAYTNSSAYAVRQTLSTEDLNNVTTPGFYNCGGGNTCTNKPEGVDHFGMYVIHCAGGTYYVQILFEKSDSARQWRRHCIAGTWSSWTLDKLSDTTYSQATTSNLGLVKLMRAALTSDITPVAAPSSYGTTRNYAVDLDKDGQMFVHVPWSNTTYSAFTGATSSAAGTSGLVPAPAANTHTRFLRGDGTWATPTNTTYAVFTGATASADGTSGLVLKPTAGNQGKFLKADGTWATPTNTTYSVVSSSANGLAPKVINTNTATVGTAYYVLASSDGLATPSWYKLPSNAFVNDDTKVTQTNTTTSASYRVLLSGNANDTTETTTARKSANLLFNPSTGNLTATSLNLNGDIVINDGTNHDRFIKFQCANGDNYGWRIGYLGDNSNSATNNYLTIDSYRNTAGWAPALQFKHNTMDATFGASVTATSFIGNLDGTYVNKLTGYSKATSASNIAATDTLKSALGKLEYKAHYAYDWIIGVTETDTDEYINKWGEIVGFLDSVKEGTDILDEFVTRKTDLTITGTKTFSKVINSANSGGSWVSGMTNASIKYDSLNAINATNYHPIIGVKTNGENVVNFGAYVNDVGFYGYKKGRTDNSYDWLFKFNSETGAITHTGTSITANKFVTSGGTSAQFVKGNGSLDSNKYLINTNDTHTSAYYRTTNVNGANYAFWSHINSAAFTIYAPTTAGTKGLVLTSNGSGAPVWSNSVSTADKTKVLSNYYSSRQTTIKPGITGDGSMIQYKSTAACTDTDKPGEGHILHFNWDNSGGWDALLCVHITTPNLSTRCMNSGTWSEWAQILTSLNYTNWINTTNFPGLNKTGTVTSIKIGSTSYSPSSGVVSLPAYPTSLKSPNAIKFKNTSGTVVSYDGSAAVDLTGGVNNAKQLDGNAETSYLRYRGEIDTTYADLTDTTVNPTNFKKPSPGMYTIRRTGSSEMFVSFAMNTGSCSSLEFKVNFPDTARLYIRKVVDSNRISGDWRALAWYSDIPTTLKNPYTLTFAAGTFAAKTYDGSAAVTVNIPTHTSHLTNNSGFLTSRGYIGTTQVQASSAELALTGISTATAKYYVATQAMALSTSAGLSTQLTVANRGGLFSNGVLFNNPTTPNDVGFIRITGTGEADTVLEIGTGDDGASSNSEAIAARLYRAGAVAKEAWLLDTAGNTSFPGSVTAASFKVPGGTSSQFLKADGSIDSNTYITSRGYIGTTAVQASSASQNLTGIGNLTMSGNLTITPGDTDNFINFSYNSGTTYSWRLGYLGTGSGDGNYLVIQSAKAAGTSWNNVIRMGNETLDAAFGGNVYPLVNNTQTLGTSSLKWSNVYATTFTGNLTGNVTGNVSGSSGSCTGNAASATYIKSSGRLTAETTTNRAAGLRLYEIYSNGYPCTYGNVLQINGANGVGQLACQWHGTGLWYRSAPDTSTTFTDWATLITDNNYTNYTVTKTGTGASGTWGINISGNAATATTLKPTTIVSAKAFDLSNTSWKDTGYTFANLATGTYAVQVTSGTNLVASGIMSVYKNLSDTAGDEIPLHVYGTAGWRPYLRTHANKLLISSNDASATSRTVTIKIAQIL